MRVFAIVIACAALSACYNPSYGDCQVSCASGACPAGLECQSGVCRAPGMTGPCAMTDAGDDGDGSGSALSIDDFTAASFASFCRYQVRCGQFEDQTSCETLLGNIAMPLVDVIAAVHAGTVIFHADKAQQCFDAQDSLTCERWKFSSNRATDPSCDAVFEGTRHDGEACGIDEQCISRVCSITNCANACCPGTCSGDTPPGPRDMGAMCTAHDRCNGGYCDRITLVCAPYKLAGENCALNDECMPGLNCIFSAATQASTCRMLTDTNGPCGSFAECANLGDVCRNGACMTGGLTGSPCAGQAECQQQHQCKNNSACALPPVIGEPCNNFGLCMTGYCLGAQGCVAKEMNGDPCNPNQGSIQCESRYCDPATSTCADKPTCN